MNTKDALIHEWSVLQTQSDAYEKHALYIKLMSINLVFIALLIKYTKSDHTDFGIVALGLIFLLSVLWLQEAIWKTFQSRLTERILVIEKVLNTSSASDDAHLVAPCQLNTQWLAQRHDFTGLMGEYLSQSIRPTVAFPHLLLIIGAGVIYIN